MLQLLGAADHVEALHLECTQNMHTWLSLVAAANSDAVTVTLDAELPAPALESAAQPPASTVACGLVIEASCHLLLHLAV